jgi:site-specific recombinase
MITSDSVVLTPTVPLVEVFRRMGTAEEDPLHLLTDLFASIRPSTRKELVHAPEIWQRMLEMLEQHPDWQAALAHTMLLFFSGREQRRFYTEAGLLPNTGFFSELYRKLAHKLLPELTDRQDLKDCIHIIFWHPGDQAWMERIPQVERARFWEILGRRPSSDREATRRMKQQLLDSALILVHRIASMGLEPELLRLLPRLMAGQSSFVALADEVSRFVERLRDTSGLADEEIEDELHLLVLLDQCRDVVRRAHQTAAAKGTSMPLTYLIIRLTQHLDRLELLVRLLAVRLTPENRAVLNERWSEFFLDAVSGERQRNSLSRHFSDLLVLLSLRVTENAGRTGEHYLARDRAEWRGIGRAAAGAGIVIALMALLKLFGYGLHLPVFSQGLLNGILYAGGFALIHLLHGIVATKQPAMTAATIAATISETRGKLRDTERLTDLIVATVRGQVAAIAGNVLVALPVALMLGMLMTLYAGGAPVSTEKAHRLLAEIAPLGGGTLAYAAVAGVWLFMAGLVSGYVDNVASYGRVGERVAWHPWLLRLAGQRFARRCGDYLDHNAGGLVGNVFFGMMLGLTPALGTAFGLPLDIRHIAFSSANLGYALVSLEFRLTWWILATSCLGVGLIGLVNLAVSFSLALLVALRSRGVHFSGITQLLPTLWQHLKKHPASFFTPV